MNFVPDGTILCGFYYCKECEMKFLDTKIIPKMICPYCGQDVDMEIGPDETLPDNLESAELVEVIEGEDEVIKMDTLLNCAFSNEDDSWI